MHRFILSTISATGRYTGLMLTLLLLNLTALADDLNSLSYDGAPGYYAAQNNVRSGGLSEMIADNDLSFSNSVPGHQEKDHSLNTNNTGIAGSQSALKSICSAILQYSERDFVPQGCPEYNLVLNNSPPVSL